MIIWIASYPKSGNTWIRSIISSLIYTEDGIFDFKLLKKIDQFPEKKYFKDLVKNYDFNEIKTNWIFAQDKINIDKNIKFFKTHSGKYTVSGSSFTNDENTLASIYIVRDPRTVIQSISHHYTLSKDDALEFMLSSQMTGNKESYDKKKFGILNLIGKWNDHYRSWTIRKKNLLLLKYEDLILKPDQELNNIISFLKNYVKFSVNENKIKNIINTTSFINLKKMENKNLFQENAYDRNTGIKKNFFNLGPNNKWENILNNKIKEKIEISFNKEMREIGYL